MGFIPGRLMSASVGNLYDSSNLILVSFYKPQEMQRCEEFHPCYAVQMENKLVYARFEILSCALRDKKLNYYRS